MCPTASRMVRLRHGDIRRLRRLPISDRSDESSPSVRHFHHHRASREQTCRIGRAPHACNDLHFPLPREAADLNCDALTGNSRHNLSSNFPPPLPLSGGSIFIACCSVRPRSTTQGLFLYVPHCFKNGAAPTRRHSAITPLAHFGSVRRIKSERTPLSPPSRQPGANLSNWSCASCV